MPGASQCGWSGLGYMPGTTTWVAACGHTGVYAHELGHNLGFHHAATPTSEYGDGSDTMGGAALVQMNSINRTKAGWLPTTNSVVNVGTSSSRVAYNLDIQVSDPYGVSTTAHAMASIIVDTTGPTLTLTNPLEGAVITGSRLTVSATATDRFRHRQSRILRRHKTDWDEHCCSIQCELEFEEGWQRRAHRSSEGDRQVWEFV